MTTPMTTQTPRKFEMVAADLRARILGGSLRAGDQLPSFPQMRAQGISQHTVEKAYALLERDGLIVRSNGNGVFVAGRSGPMASGHGLNTLGFVMAEGFARHPYWSAVLEGVNQGALRHGLRVQLLHPDQEPIAWEKVDGVLGSGLALPALMRRLPTEIPCVALLQQASEVAAVTLDESQGIRDAIEHLLALGHRRIAYLYAGYPDMRGEAYFQTLEQAGIEVQPAWMRREEFEGHATSFMDFGRSQMETWLGEGFASLGCTALLCHNDETALGALGVLKDAGYSVPGDISLVGFDGTRLCELASPALTSVEVPLHKVGETGVALLLEQWRAGQESSSARRVVRLSLTLRPRGSTGPVKN